MELACLLRVECNGVKMIEECKRLGKRQGILGYRAIPPAGETTQLCIRGTAGTEGSLRRIDIRSRRDRKTKETCCGDQEEGWW